MTNTFSIPKLDERVLSNSILNMVMENPIQLTMVNAVPLIFTGALAATKVENCGESAMTTIPQKSKKEINKTGEKFHTKGDKRQHNPESVRA